MRTLDDSRILILAFTRPVSPRSGRVVGGISFPP